MNRIPQEYNENEEPHAVADLTYDELIELIGVISDPESDEELQSYCIGIINSTLPGANVSDLIFWPNAWFKDETMLHADLNATEIANYILAWTGRRLPGSETVELPVIPESKRNDPPNVILL